jgi:hypothetical protein
LLASTQLLSFLFLLAFLLPAGVPEITGVHAIAAIPALIDDQCSAVAGFSVVAEVPAVAGVHTVAVITALLASLLWIPCRCLHP